MLATGLADPGPPSLDKTFRKVPDMNPRQAPIRCHALALPLLCAAALAACGGGNDAPAAAAGAAAGASVAAALLVISPPAWPA